VQLVGPPGRYDLVLALAAELDDAAGLRPGGLPRISAFGGSRV